MTMNVLKLTKLPAVREGFRIDPELPVLCFAADIKTGARPAPHRHPRGQLIYAERGIMNVITAAGRWIVPPSLGIWVPPDVKHQVTFTGPVSLRNVFIDPSVVNGFFDQC